MNRIGLELLQQVDKNADGFAELLSNHQLPPKFLDFITLFKIGYKSFKLEKIVLNDDEMDFYPLTSIVTYDGVQVDGEEYFGTIDHIFPYKKVLDEIEKYKNKEENWNKFGFIQIGLIYQGDVLLLGVENKNRDEIWRYGQGLLSNVHTKLEDNIFDLFMRSKEVLLQEDLEDWGIKPYQIYKLLTEDFWRVRKENV
ncbi:hypothetical protein [Flavobacterium muglaense]|uniref:Uncharacterized protein n=1 Tax=Flavobacterium muglaense TaxID=2764716 RepID=A0A923MYH2_9FLAO|nr:hypothetical protein [Flavobacterium muglaense]MBC5837497.1 hypothetical protein [Flavobacterium muglaense]MBC5844086.1 hypothetical protein [Flavobacterium muglaense]